RLFCVCICLQLARAVFLYIVPESLLRGGGYTSRRSYLALSSKEDGLGVGIPCCAGYCIDDGFSQLGLDRAGRMEHPLTTRLRTLI
ncbi:hypothetical protein ACX40Y_18205, partial [Sphingomonas sp. RS6]